MLIHAILYYNIMNIMERKNKVKSMVALYNPYTKDTITVSITKVKAALKCWYKLAL